MECSEYKPGESGLLGPLRTLERYQRTQCPAHIQTIGRKVALGNQFPSIHKLPRRC